MAKPYDVGLIVMRAQSFHNGHKSLVDLALLLCDRVIIEVGSAQESGTLRNPYNVATRIEMIKEVYPEDNVIVRALADLTHEGDISTEWGDYLMGNVHGAIYKNPDVMIYGNEGTNLGTTWFTKETMANTTEIVVNRNTIPISATMMRDALMRGDTKFWMDNTPSKMHKHIDRLRGELMEVEAYRDMLNGG